MPSTLAEQESISWNCSRRGCIRVYTFPDGRRTFPRFEQRCGHSVKMSAADAVPVVDDQTREPRLLTVGSNVARPWCEETWHMGEILPKVHPPLLSTMTFFEANNRNEKESARFVSSNLSVPTSRLTTTLRSDTDFWGLQGSALGGCRSRLYLLEGQAFFAPGLGCVRSHSLRRSLTSLMFFT